MIDSGTASSPEERAAPVMRGRRRRRRAPPNSTFLRHGAAVPYGFVTPAVMVIAVVLTFPVAYSLYGSLFRQELLFPETPFVGLENYTDLFRSTEFWDAAKRSLVFLTGMIVIGTAMALAFSFALMHATGGLRVLRTLTLFPYFVSGVATAVLFRLMFNNEFGLPNQVLGAFGIDGPSWLAEPRWAMLSVILAQLWGDLPVSILLLLGGLQGINPEYLDAADVDGATGFQKLRRIYLPLLRPQLVLSMIFLSYSGVSAFAIVLSLTGGGPGTATETLGILMYRTAFQRLDMGEALAVVITLLLVNAVIVGCSAWFGRSRDAA